MLISNVSATYNVTYDFKLINFNRKLYIDEKNIFKVIIFKIYIIRTKHLAFLVQILTTKELYNI